MTPEEIVGGVLHRMIRGLRARDADAVVATMTEDVVLYGSGGDEQADGHAEVRFFLADIFSREGTVGWAWERLTARRTGDLIWFVGPAEVVVELDDEGVERFPYRLSGVLRERDGQWLFELFNGAEPAEED